MNRQETESVAYPGIFFRWGSTNSVEVEVEGRENGDLGAVAS
jgi:hypothetical protein